MIHSDIQKWILPYKHSRHVFTACVT